MVLAGSIRAESAAGIARPAAPVSVIASPSYVGSAVLREIDDPATGDQWLLVRDPDRPVGPGRLVLVRRGTQLASGKTAGVSEAARPAAQTIVQAGDLLLVEEHTAVVDARLEAVALEPAVKGATFRARLKIGGAVVRAVAESRGHAILETLNQVGP